MARVIRIVPYDTGWPDEFAELAKPIRAALGAVALRIDHIGSTSVPGLPAKDVIDIQVTVESLDSGFLAGKLLSPGYSLRDDISGDHVPVGADPTLEEWRKVYFRAPEAQRPTHLHVRQAGRANQRYPLLFRDFLRANPAMAGIYAQIKRELSRLHPHDVDAYYAIKDPVCDLIMDSAERWVLQTGYTPGPTDA
jgi:GrpB-like predicted nucleotidyltransferase (UPF0157 family)